MVTINVHVFPRCDGSSWYSGQPCHVCWVHCHPTAVCAGLGGYCHGNGGHLHPVPPPPHSNVGQDHRQDSEAGVQHPYQHPSCAGIPLRTLQHHLKQADSCVTFTPIAPKPSYIILQYHKSLSTVKRVLEL